MMIWGAILATIGMVIGLWIGFTYGRTPGGFSLTSDEKPAETAACCGMGIVAMIGGVLLLWGLIKWSSANKPARPQYPPPPGYYPQQQPPPGQQPYQQAPPMQYAPQQPPPGQYPQQPRRSDLLAPGKPSNFSAKKAKDSITLTWEPPGDQGSLPVDKMKVFRGLEPKGMKAIAEVPVDTTEYVDRTVETGTTYYYRVAAISGAGEGRRTPPLKATIFAPPGNPIYPSATVEEGRVIIEWKPPTEVGESEVKHYVVLRGPTEDELEPIAEDVEGLSFKDPDVEPGTTYHYVVKAVGKGGESQPSKAVSVELEE
jgi:hypothetical protein